MQETQEMPLQLTVNKDKGISLKGRIQQNPDGPDLVFAEGVSEPMIGAPRQNVLHHLEKSKPIILAAVNLFHGKSRQLITPYKKMAPCAKATHDAFDKLINYEVKWDKFHRQLWSKLRDMLCLIVQDDFPYRWRWQALIQELSKDPRMKITEADKIWIQRQADWNFMGDNGGESGVE